MNISALPLLLLLLALWRPCCAHEPYVTITCTDAQNCATTSGTPVICAVDNDAPGSSNHVPPFLQSAFTIGENIYYISSHPNADQVARTLANRPSSPLSELEDDDDNGTCASPSMSSDFFSSVAEDMPTIVFASNPVPKLAKLQNNRIECGERLGSENCETDAYKKRCKKYCPGRKKC